MTSTRVSAPGEEVTDLMAGGEAMAELEAELAELSGSVKPPIYS